MKSHDLAKLLLDLPNKRIVIVKPKGGGSAYHQDFEIYGNPWEDFIGSIRIQIQLEEFYVDAKPRKEEKE